MTSVTVTLIVEAAKRRGWAVRSLSPEVYVLETPDGAPFYLRNVLSYKGPGINSYLTKHKDVLYDLIATSGIGSIPETVITDIVDGAALQLLDTHKRVVVKPTDQSHGNGVSVGIETAEQLEQAVAYARRYGDRVIVQQHVDGADYRVLFIGGAYVAAVERTPAAVTGDGVKTIRELIDEDNDRDTASLGYDRPPARKINLDAAQRYLGDDGLDDVPDAGAKVRVVGTANISNGGQAIDRTDKIPRMVIDDAARVLKYLRLEFAGVDYIVQDGRAYLIEINIMPSFGLHSRPTVGTPRDVAGAFLDWLERGTANSL